MAEFRVNFHLYFFVLLGCFYRVQTELAVTILEKSPLLAEKGSDLQLSCHVNKGLPIILTHSIDWVKESRVPGLTNETLLISRQQTLEVEDASLLDRYDINLISNAAEQTVKAVLVIKEVEEADDGRYVCKITAMGSSRVVTHANIDVIVPRAADEVNLKVDGREVSASSIVVIPGSHTLLCISNGSNPAGDVAIRLGSRTVSLNKPATSSLMRAESLKAGAPRYSVQAEARFDLTKAENGEIITCRVGETEGGVSTSTILAVVDKPTVDCADVTVGRNDTRVRLMCVVTHADVIIDDLEWQIHESGGTVYSAEPSADTDVVSSEVVSDQETKVFLNLDVERWGEAPAIFTLTVITQVGDVSDNVSLTVESENDEDTTDEDNTNGDDTSTRGDNQDKDNNTDNTDDDDDDDNNSSEEKTEDDTSGTLHSQPSATIILGQPLLLLLIFVVLNPTY